MSSISDTSIAPTPQRVNPIKLNSKVLRAQARARSERLRLLSILMASPDEVLEDDWLAVHVLGHERRRAYNWQEQLRRTADDLRVELGRHGHRLQRIRGVGYRWRSRWTAPDRERVA